MKNRFWGISIAILGTWEAASFGTRGKVPTISKLVWMALGRKARPVVRLAIIAYLLGAARHLLNPNNSS